MITASPSQNLTGSMHQTARLDGFREGTFYDTTWLVLLTLLLDSCMTSFKPRHHMGITCSRSSAVSFFRLQQGHAPTVNIAGGPEIHKDKPASEIPHVGSNTRVKANIDV